MARTSERNVFEGIHLDVLNEYIEKGVNHADMEPEIQEYIKQLEFIQARMHRVESPSNVMKSLKTFFPDLSIAQCRSRFNDALEFFHLDDTTSRQSWNNYLFDLAMKSIELRIKTLGPEDDPLKIVDALLKAKQIKGLDAEDEHDVDPKLLEEKFEVFSLKPKDVGLPVANRHLLAQQIDQFPIEENQKFKLKMEAGLNDIKLDMFSKNHGEGED